jgi:hypothetical protein
MNKFKLLAGVSFLSLTSVIAFTISPAYAQLNPGDQPAVIDQPVIQNHCMMARTSNQNHLVDSGVACGAGSGTPGGANNTVQINTSGSFSGVGPGTTSTLLHGNAGGPPAYNPVALGTDVSGTLPVANGGIGVGTLAAHGVVIGNGTSAPAVSGAGTAGQVLTSNGASADPTFQAGGGSSTPGGTNHQTQINGAGSFAGVGPGTSGQVLTSNGASSDPTFQTVTGTGTVTSVAITAPTFLSVSGSPITGAGTLALSLSGTALPAANGGTGATTLTAHGVVVGNGGSALAATAAGTTGQVLTSNGSSADPTFQTVTGTGTVTSVGTGDGLTGGPITTTGTVKATEALGNSGAAITATTYPISLTAVTGDLSKELLFTGSSASAWSLGASTPGQGFDIVNQGTATITVTCTGNCNGNATLAITPGQSANVFAGTSTWWASVAGSAGITLTTTGSSGAATLVGSTLNVPVYAGSGNGIVLLQSVDISTPTATINLALTAGYKKYRLETWGIDGASATALRMQVSNNAGSSYFTGGTDYFQNLIYLIAPSIAPAGTSGNIGYVGLGDVVATGNYRYVNNMDIDPGDGTYYPAFFTNQTGDSGTTITPAQLMAFVEVWLKTATTINAVQLAADAGNLTAGHIRLWGIQ